MIDLFIATVTRNWPLLFVPLLAWFSWNRYQNGLHKYPGPFLASVTDWWRFFDVHSRRPERTHQLLHAKYGDVIRLGPNTLSFACPQAVKDIYGLNKGFRKVSHTESVLRTILT